MKRPFRIHVVGPQRSGTSTVTKLLQEALATQGLPESTFVVLDASKPMKAIWEDPTNADDPHLTVRVCLANPDDEVVVNWMGELGELEHRIREFLAPDIAARVAEQGDGDDS